MVELSCKKIRLVQICFCRMEANLKQYVERKGNPLPLLEPSSSSFFFFESLESSQSLVTYI